MIVHLFYFAVNNKRRQETGDWRPETGDWRPETGDRRPETGDRRQETGDRKNADKSIHYQTPTLFFFS
ncbi:MAG: hypothetical protein ACOZDD_11860 [Bacteroidota bacterium]